MHRIDHSTAAVSIPAAEASGSPGYFREGDPVGGTPATIVTADWANAVQEELISVLDAAAVPPSKVDNAQLLASIYALGGNFAGVVLHASSVTLGAAHIGRINSLSADTSQTLTLPLAASVSAGKAVAFIGAGAAAVLTVARSGSDYIDVPLGTSTASIVLKFGDTLRLVSNGVDRWIPIGGSASLARASGNFAKNIAANGYQKLPTGLYIQWGGATGSASADVTIAFPISFPASCHSFLAFPSAGSGIGYFCSFNALGVSSVNLGSYSATTTRVGCNVKWIAIGA